MTNSFVAVVVKRGCPNAEELAALLSRAMGPIERAAIADHAAGCAECHGVIENLVGGGTASIAPSADAPAGVPTSSPRDAHRIGRYRLLEIVGKGGMGVVWGAWDPELARRVALKLLHPTIGAARERIVAEGRALAQLSHPNVVPVYDVGVIDDHVYLVMEWIQGTTLRSYAASPCTQRELIDAYRQAGEGLAAAHQAGLVHRDFKPDNAVRGDDGRVRVLDFGLARSAAIAGGPTDDGKRLAGTPRYMAPEQATGATVTAAADQYAFAVSLRESLYRTTLGRPLEPPAWLETILARATARDPADRFASLRDLLRALARDPARTWARRALVLAAVAAAVSAFVLGRTQAGDAAPCTGSAEQLTEIWNPTVRAATSAHLASLGAYGAGQAARLTGELDRYSATWLTARTEACRAYLRSELTAPLYERQLACLARGKFALAAATDLLRSTAGVDLASAENAARELPSPLRCSDPDPFPSLPPPEATAIVVAIVEPLVEAARTLAIAERPEAANAAAVAVAAAERTHYAPLRARALIIQGRAQMAIKAGAAITRATFARAIDLAMRGYDDLLAVEAYARLIYVVSRAEPNAVTDWSGMDAIAARTGAHGRFARALLYNNKAAARLAAGDRDGAHALLLLAIAESPSPLTGHELELTGVRHNLILSLTDAHEREHQALQLVRERTALFGADHPSTLRARHTAALVASDTVAAARDLVATCDVYHRLHPHLAATTASCYYDHAWIADQLGDRTAALRSMRAAASDRSATNRNRTAIAAGYLQIVGDDAAPPQMLPQASVELEIRADALARSANWWDHGLAADARIAAAHGWSRAGDARRAEQAWSSALTLLAGQDAVLLTRKRARASSEVARRQHR